MANKEAPEALAIYWRQQVEAWQSSDQSQKVFCEAGDLNYHQFGYWVRKFRKQAEQDKCPRSSSFVPVTVSARNEPDGLSIMLPNGVRVQGIVNGNLSTVYRLLAHLS